jgi:hypothetical protein
MSDKPLLDRVLALAEANPQLQQFGQPPNEDDEVWHGKTACTHTVCQMLNLVWNGEKLSLNQVNRMAGMPKNATSEKGKPRGMRPPEFRRFLQAAGIPMVLRFGLPFGELLKASNRAPVFYAMRYGSAPRKSADRPNGSSQRGGKEIDDIRHAVLMLGFLEIPGRNGGPSRIEVFRKEPNHGSPNRRERPPYDTLSDREARIEYEDYHKLLRNPLYAALPTRALPLAGASLAEADMPGLTVTDLQPFTGFATVVDGTRSAVQIADRQFIRLPAGTEKRVFATGKLVPRLKGPPGDRTNVVLIGDEAAILLRMDVVLKTEDGSVVPPPPPPEDADPAPGSKDLPEDIPEGIPFDEEGDPDRFSNDAVAAD